MKSLVIAITVLCFACVAFSSTVLSIPLQELSKSPLKLYHQRSAFYLEEGFSSSGYVYPVSSFPDVTAGKDYSQRMKEDLAFREKLSRIEPVGLFLVLWKDFTALRSKPGDALWVSANGFIYDVTKLPLWANGRHRNLHQVGEELTYQLMRRSPHGAKILEKATVIGILGFEWDDLTGMNGKQYNYHMVAAETLVYDVTQLNRWRGGNHMGQHKSGEELTYQLLQRAPHALSLLGRGYAVGVLVCERSATNTILGKNNSYESKPEAIYDKRIQKPVCRIVE